MIDENVLIEGFLASLNTGKESFSVDLIIEFIEDQPKIEKCSDCSRRKFYQMGYEAAKRKYKR